MELEIVPLGQLWPDPNNPRKDFGDLDAMAATFESNPVRPFEPVNPPVVVPDGELNGAVAYRIVDGERRWRAMRERGAVQACACIVCNMDEANAMAAMVATDDKAPLTDAELSRGVQQMLAVGVAPEEVDKAARLRRGTASRIKKVAAKGTEQMSIAHLLAAEELDGEDREKVLRASESDYERVAQDMWSRRKTDAQVAAMEEACADAGVPMVETSGEANGDGRIYKGSTCFPEDVAEEFSGMPDGTVGWICRSAYPRPDVRFFGPPAGEDDAEEAEDAEWERRRMLVDAAKAARSTWLLGRIVDSDDFPGECSPILEAFRADRKEPLSPYNYTVSDWLKNYAEDVEIVETGHIVYAFAAMCRSPFYWMGIDEKDAPRWLALGDVMQSLGYEPSPDERELTDIVRDLLSEAAEGDDEEEEESDD